MRLFKSYPLTPKFKEQLLYWGSTQTHFCFLDSNADVNRDYLNSIPSKTSYELIAAIGCKTFLNTNHGTAFENLKQFIDTENDWAFGYLGYDLKNELEQLSSNHPNHTGFNDLVFFIPELVVLVQQKKLTIGGFDEQAIERAYQNIIGVTLAVKNNSQQISPTMRSGKDEYIKSVNNIKKHIQRGDIYETNFCVELFSENATIDPVLAFKKLNTITEAPFSTFLKLNSHYVLGASPERFLKKEGDMLWAQPIKGTARRSEITAEDEKIKRELKASPKEQNENVMIVDLVRNDLSHVAEKGSVFVKELFGAYSFKTVHQLVSTIGCKLKSGVHAVDAIRFNFPMGSMTGAPKIKAMELMEKHESFRRGVYSGAIGYFTPTHDFDFNVVIRSIIYNSENKYLSIGVGSAITSGAQAEQEYNECLLKAHALIQTLENA